MKHPNYRILHRLFSMPHPEWYESLDYYPSGSELLAIARAVVPPSWQMAKDEIWSHVRPSEAKLPEQGWKIHVSATPFNCHEVLHTVALMCVRMEGAFKFSLDRRLVQLSTSKGWGREASGKFITIYPYDREHFISLIEALYDKTREFDGPYVLSDRRYKDSRVIHYRYGGIEGTRNLTSQGDKSYVLTTPDGDQYPDLRSPYWNPPPWVSDPFNIPEVQEENDQVPLKEGRYRIDSALATSVTGGAYLGTDFETGSTVVVKEARPFTGVDDEGIDAIGRLQKEYRLLQKLQDTRVAPAPIDLFLDWEHMFLVEEYIPGPDLGHFTIASNPLMAQFSEQARRDYVQTLTKIWANIALCIETIHNNGIVCGDLSLGNVIIEGLEYGKVRIVDWEAAWEEGVDPPTSLSTPGFTSPSRKVMPTKEDDIYTLGAIMLGTLFPINFLLEIAP